MAEDIHCIRCKQTQRDSSLDDLSDGDLSPLQRKVKMDADGARTRGESDKMNRFTTNLGLQSVTKQWKKSWPDEPRPPEKVDIPMIRLTKHQSNQSIPAIEPGLLNPRVPKQRERIIPIAVEADNLPRILPKDELHLIADPMERRRQYLVHKHATMGEADRIHGRFDDPEV